MWLMEEPVYLAITVPASGSKVGGGLHSVKCTNVCISQRRLVLTCTADLTGEGRANVLAQGHDIIVRPWFKPTTLGLRISRGRLAQLLRSLIANQEVPVSIPGVELSPRRS